jgi:hypothetical protein
LVLGQRLRVGVIINLLGFAVLGASLYAWGRTNPHHRLYYTEDEYQWVPVDSSSAPAVETAELWRAPASCQLPYFVKAAVQAKAKLKTYSDAAPEEIRALRDRADRRLVLQPAADKTPFYYFLKREQQERARSIAGTDYDAQLHAKYTEWYVTVSKLEELAKQWEERLSNLADRRDAFTETRLRSADVPASSRTDRDLDRYGLSLLGLSGFPDDQQRAIKAACVKIIPVKKIVAKIHYYTEIWRWPIDHVAAFWFGLELVLVGAFFGPITTWISSGDVRTAWRHVGDAAGRLVTTSRGLLARIVLIASPLWQRLVTMSRRLLARSVLVASPLRQRFVATSRRLLASSVVLIASLLQRRNRTFMNLEHATPDAQEPANAEAH